MQIRKVKLEDLKELIGLLEQLSPHSEQIDLEKLQTILDNITKDEKHYLCVVEEDNQVIGTGVLLIQLNISHNGRPYGHIENIVVDSDHRKKGIGKKIVLHLLEKAKEANCYKVILNCIEKNIPFYEKYGITPTGEIELRIDL